MSLFDDPPLHDFPDRAIRRLLEDPATRPTAVARCRSRQSAVGALLRDLIASLLPDLVDRFDFSRMEPVNREFLLEDWRRRENDLLFRLPFHTQSGDVETWALVCLLIEHQSRPDPPMPLRLLLYAVLFWESEWRAWEAEHPESEPLRLTPVIPVVFHTGTRVWRTYRELAELMECPGELRAFAPQWPALFWDLAERTPEELLSAAGEWLAALAVVRAERVDEAAFQEVFTAVLKRLEGLSERERVRWHDLLWFVLSWALRRGPRMEKEALIDAVRRSQMDVKHREEAAEMSETIYQRWEQEAFSRGEIIGEARGRAAERIEARRQVLRLILEDRFGPLPEALQQQIDAIEDPERLRDALLQAARVSQLSDLEL